MSGSSDQQNSSAMRPVKVRLDVWLVDLGHFESREKAQRAIMAGNVLVNEVVIDKPGTKVLSDRTVRVRKADRYVGRGGYKLEGALNAFGIHPEGRVCLDVGASTGGFTDCLLQRGAKRVFAVDVGQNQLHHRLQMDPRVTSFEKINARRLEATLFDEIPDFFVADVSFISLELILPSVREVLAPRGEGVVLIKPQFELAKELVGKGGIVREPERRAMAVEKIRSAALAGGWEWLGVEASVIAGMDGNQEFLAYLKKGDQ